MSTVSSIGINASLAHGPLVYANGFGLHPVLRMMKNVAGAGTFSFWSTIIMESMATKFQAGLEIVFSTTLFEGYLHWAISHS